MKHKRQAGNEYTVVKGLRSHVFIVNCIQWIQIYVIIYRLRSFDLHLLRPSLPIIIFPAELSLCAIPFLSSVGDGRFQTRILPNLIPK